MRRSDASPRSEDVQHFLSVYMESPDITALTVQRHDHCAALWRATGSTVVLQRYWEFERVTGFKHHRLPLREPEDARAFIDGLLGEEGLCLDDMTAVWGTPHLETERGFTAHVGDRQSVHSTAHLFSAIGMDWAAFRADKILGLAFDAGPDLQLDRHSPEFLYSGCAVEDGVVTTFPIESPATLWLLARGRLGMEEGTLMALGSATTCTVDLDVEDLVRDLPFWRQSEVFASADTVLDRAIAAVDEVLGSESGRDSAGYDDRFTEEENRASAITKIIELASWIVTDRTIERVRKEHGLDLSEMHLAICGGFALNCPNNSRLVDQYGFRSLMAPPCANDSGQALGLGILGLHDRGLTRDRDFRLGTAAHGRLPSDLDAALHRFADAVEDVSELDLDRVCDDLVAAPIAWVHGPAEIGPRALGHRSLLGDPRHSATKDVLNWVKQRQWWRPVAPIVLEESVGDWFVQDRPSPYMLEVFQSRSERRSLIEPVLHLDGTARIQTVNGRDEPLLYEIVKRFGLRTGVPIIANTSLNDRGEPLVDNAVQALNFCVRKGVRVAYIGSRRVVLRADAAEWVVLDGPEPRVTAPFERDSARWSSLWESWTNRGLDPEALFVYSWNPYLRNTVDPLTDEGARVVRVAASAFLSRSSERELRFVRHLAKHYGPGADPLVSDRAKDLIGGG